MKLSLAVSVFTLGLASAVFACSGGAKADSGGCGGGKCKDKGTATQPVAVVDGAAGCLACKDKAPASQPASVLTLGDMGHGDHATKADDKHDHKHGDKDKKDGPATAPAAVDVGNTKCIIMPEDDVTEGVTYVHEGKAYHFCCKKCIGEFKKDPAKYIKAIEENPAKYGITKSGE